MCIRSAFHILHDDNSEALIVGQGCILRFNRGVRLKCSAVSASSCAEIMREESIITEHSNPFTARDILPSISNDHCRKSTPQRASSAQFHYFVLQLIIYVFIVSLLCDDLEVIFLFAFCIYDDYRCRFFVCFVFRFLLFTMFRRFNCLLNADAYYYWQNCCYYYFQHWHLSWYWYRQKRMYHSFHF